VIPVARARSRAARAAILCAALSVVLCLYGSILDVRIFRSVQPNVLPWIAVPLVAATGGMLFSLTRWFGPIWLCAGALFGFVVLGAWSIGLPFGYGALAMFAAALAHLTAIQPDRSTTLAAIWMFAGAGAVSAVFFVRDVLQDEHHAPAVVWGMWLFVAMSATLLLAYAVRRVRRTA
jgi:hypothetical protein